MNDIALRCFYLDVELRWWAPVEAQRKVKVFIKHKLMKAFHRSGSAGFQLNGNDSVQGDGFGIKLLKRGKR